MNDFDQFPLYDVLVKSNGKMSDIWCDSMATFLQNLIGYLTSTGIQPPVLTQNQINNLVNVIPPKIIYNSTIGEYQAFNNGVWKIINLI